LDGEAWPAIDVEEASHLLDLISFWPLKAWIASIHSQPAGFVILGPDLGTQLKRARGGRNFFWRAWLLRAKRLPTRQGRIYFGGVLPHWRGQGIGRRLLRQAAGEAQKMGWERITLGPIPEDAPAAGFLQRAGARPCQSYQLFRWDL
jgi:ribosomal protein S18 acetylase RimI-like enzyme